MYNQLLTQSAPSWSFISNTGWEMAQRAISYGLPSK
jgi:hypothetical protein